MKRWSMRIQRLHKWGLGQYRSADCSCLLSLQRNLHVPYRRSASSLERTVYGEGHDGRARVRAVGRSSLGSGGLWVLLLSRLCHRRPLGVAMAGAASYPCTFQTSSQAASYVALLLLLPPPLLPAVEDIGCFWCLLYNISRTSTSSRLAQQSYLPYHRRAELRSTVATMLRLQDRV